MGRDALNEMRDTDELSKQFTLFRDQLAEHEHEENKLIQDFYNVDIGTKD